MQNGRFTFVLFLMGSLSFAFENSLEGVRHCRWVDEVVEDAPWVIDAAFIEKHQIDYVAHDEEAYQSAGYEDVYGFAKSLGTSALGILICMTQ